MRSTTGKRPSKAKPRKSSTMHVDPAGFFEAAYASEDGVPIWDLDQPLPTFIRMERAGRLRGRILDVGCGTGENAVYLASRGHQVCGVDLAPTAVRRAREKAKARGVPATFRVLDAVRLGRLGERFDTVVDCGLYHVLPESLVSRFVDALASVTRRGGRYVLLCFSDREPNWGGPRRISREEIRARFAQGWHVEFIRPARHPHRGAPRGALAWLASIRRTDS